MKNKLAHTQFKHPKHRSQGPKASGNAGPIRSVGRSGLPEKKKKRSESRIEVESEWNTLADAFDRMRRG